MSVDEENVLKPVISPTMSRETDSYRVSQMTPLIKPSPKPALTIKDILSPVSSPKSSSDINKLITNILSPKSPLPSSQTEIRNRSRFTTSDNSVYDINTPKKRILPPSQVLSYRAMPSSERDKPLSMDSIGSPQRGKIIDDGPQLKLSPKEENKINQSVRRALVDSEVADVVSSPSKGKLPLVVQTPISSPYKKIDVVSPVKDHISSINLGESDNNILLDDVLVDDDLSKFNIEKDLIINSRNPTPRQAVSLSANPTPRQAVSLSANPTPRQAVSLSANPTPIKTQTTNNTPKTQTTNNTPKTQTTNNTPKTQTTNNTPKTQTTNNTPTKINNLNSNYAKLNSNDDVKNKNIKAEKIQREEDEDDDEEDNEKDEDLTEEEERVLLLARIKTIRKMDNTIDLPLNIDKFKIGKLRKFYLKCKTRLLAKELSGGFKKYLIAIFAIIEVVCVSFLQINEMRGYAAAQCDMINSYDEIMIELAEKYGTGYKDKFSVESRLIFAMVLNTVIFVIVKKMTGDANSGIAKTIMSVFNGGVDNSGTSNLIGGVMNMFLGKEQPIGETIQPPPPKRRRKDASKS